MDFPWPANPFINIDLSLSKTVESLTSNLLCVPDCIISIGI